MWRVLEIRQKWPKEGPGEDEMEKGGTAKVPEGLRIQTLCRTSPGTPCRDRLCAKQGETS